MRALVILGVVIVGLVALLSMRPARVATFDQPQLSYVTTAHQLGVVGYRDPAGAISPDGKRFAYFTADRVYFASPADHGMVALWTADLRTKKARRLSSFGRDAYAPSTAADGTVVFKVQSYRTFIADVPAGGGPTRQLAIFQSETPSYHPAQPLIAFTYGTQSDSEDQAMTWSPDGRLVLLDGARKSDGRSVLYTIGVDQDSGAVTWDLAALRAEGVTGDVTHAEWRGNDAIVALAKVAPGRHELISLPITGGRARVIHRFETEHDFSGLGISPDGKYLAFTAPASNGYYQIYKVSTGGDAAPIQLTADPSNKTQPAWSPDGARVAFTIWSYDATFWSFKSQ